MASGTTSSTAQIRRPGKSVRSTSHAAAVPMTAHSTVTTTVSRTVFQSSDAVNGRKIWLATASNPARCDSMSRNTSGMASSAAIAVLLTSNPIGRLARLAGTAGTFSVADGAGSVFTALSPSQQPGLAHQRDRGGAVA